MPIPRRRLRLVLVSLALLGGFALPGSALLGTSAGAATPTAAITPGSRVADGQIVTIRGAGFPAHTNIEVLECAGAAAHLPRDATHCEGFTADTTGYSDAQGNFLDAPGDVAGGTSGYHVYALPTPLAKAVSIRCGPNDPCVLYVGVDFQDFKLAHVFIPISFGSGPATASSGSKASWVVPALVVLLLLAGGGLFLIRRRRPEGVTATTR